MKNKRLLNDFLRFLRSTKGKDFQEILNEVVNGGGGHLGLIHFQFFLDKKVGLSRAQKIRWEKIEKHLKDCKQCQDDFCLFRQSDPNSGPRSMLPEEVWQKMVSASKER